jgi:hypothetical protein
LSGLRETHLRAAGSSVRISRDREREDRTIVNAKIGAS